MTEPAASEVNRRRFLGIAARAGILASATGLLQLPLSSCTSLLPSGPPAPRLLPSKRPLPAPFTVTLPVPPVLTPSTRTTDTDIYELTARPARAEILPGTTTPIWGYHGMFPGPTILAGKDRPVLLRLHTELPVPTVLHLHGGRTPPGSDGFPTDLILPKGWSGQVADPAAVTTGEREYRYPNDQTAATLWYHDHRMDYTAPQLWRGLFGAYLIHDPAEDNLGLPAADRDVPLLICDRSFDTDAAFQYPSIDPALHDTPGVNEQFTGGVLGDVILVNGAPWPEMEVAACRYRFRLLNASNARRYVLALDPPVSPLVHISSDAGLLHTPTALPELPLSPGERYDIIVDFAGAAIGSTIVLRNTDSAGSTGQVMRFRVTSTVRDDSRIPPKLTDTATDVPTPPTATRHLDFSWKHGQWTINGQPFDPARPDITPRLGQPETWTLTSDADHPVHIHGAPFQVLSRAGGLRPTDRGWKDTIHLSPAQPVTITTRFSPYPGRYLAHCHNLEHEDMAMMAVVQVLP